MRSKRMILIILDKRRSRLKKALIILLALSAVAGIDLAGIDLAGIDLAGIDIEKRASLQGGERQKATDRGTSARGTSLPTYAEAHKALLRLWEQSYPVALQQLSPDPEQRGVLSSVRKGRRSYCYHFLATVSRPKRGEQGNILTGGQRRIEIWACYRNWPKKAWELSFARQDFLAGRGSRWIDIK